MAWLWTFVAKQLPIQQILFLALLDYSQFCELSLLVIHHQLASLDYYCNFFGFSLLHWDAPKIPADCTIFNIIKIPEAFIFILIRLVSILLISIPICWNNIASIFSLNLHLKEPLFQSWIYDIVITETGKSTMLVIFILRWCLNVHSYFKLRNLLDYGKIYLPAFLIVPHTKNNK